MTTTPNEAAPPTFFIVTEDGNVDAPDVDSFLMAAKILGHEPTGALRQRGSIPLRPVLLGQPTFKTLAGPMFDGGRIRYETIKMNERLAT
jgi:hypothetical protein